ncbi:MAG TPA: DUF899 family protein [Kofleriaceae bacterium]|jgi:predicted dithiol-disulfide oxidoreductase (DUF899 family)
MEKPPVTDAATWQKERDALLVEEKRLTRELDALAAKRRRLSMVEFPKVYKFTSPAGTRTLHDLFDGRPQLVIYQFMDLGPGKFCPGCTGFSNNITMGAMEYLHQADMSWCNISNMPIEQIEAYKAKMGWTMPFVSSHGTTWTEDIGSPYFQLSVWLRDGEKIYRTYTTTKRGVDRLLFSSNIMDLLPYGRQQEWEDSPTGWPQHPTYGRI